MPDQITIHDYQVPDVTFEEADTIARNVFGNSMISPDFVEKVLLILQDDRARVAGLQDPWVEVPEGATIPEGVPYRVEYPEGAAWEYVTARDWVPPLTAATLFVRKSDLLRVAPVKTRRERIIEEMPRMVAALRAVLRQADALDELAASPIGASYAGALRLGARGIRRAITKAMGAES